jgi:hypothetical protein
MVRLRFKTESKKKSSFRKGKPAVDIKIEGMLLKFLKEKRN